MRAFYELTDSKDKADLIVDTIFLKAVELDSQTEAKILSEAGEWLVISTYKYTQTLYWHNDDEKEGEEYCIINTPMYVVRDGTYIGQITQTENTSGFGMRCNVSKCYAVFFTNGDAYGKTHTYCSHSSTEVDVQGTKTYALIRKSQAKGIIGQQLD